MARKSEKLKKAMRKLDDRELNEVVGGDKTDLLFAKLQLERNQMESGNSPAGAFFHGAASVIHVG